MKICQVLPWKMHAFLRNPMIIFVASSFGRKEAVALSCLACRPMFLITEWGGNGQSTDGSDRKSRFLEGHTWVLLPWHWVSLAKNKNNKDWDGEEPGFGKQEPNSRYCCTMHQLYDPHCILSLWLQFSHLWRGWRWEWRAECAALHSGRKHTHRWEIVSILWPHLVPAREKTRHALQDYCNHAVAAPTSADIEICYLAFTPLPN